LEILKNRAWAVIAARGGSKSIPLKNIVPICGKPLIEYCILATQQAKSIERVFCTTDHEKIEEVAHRSGVEIIRRPSRLGGDMVSSIDVVIHAVEQIANTENHFAEIILLVQPTSVFLTAKTIDLAIGRLQDNKTANSVQTITQVPHHFHAYNQRIIDPDTGEIHFAFPEKRMPPYNKQSKLKFYAIGNLVATRTEALLAEKNFSAPPSIPLEIPLCYAYDLDGPEDISMAEGMIRSGIVVLDD